VVYLYLYQINYFFKEMPLLFQDMDNSQHFLIVDLVIILYQKQELAIKGY